MIRTKNFSAVLLAGGIGTRMGTSIPKQFLPLQGKPLALYSLDVFAAIPELDEIIIVCDPEYRYLFAQYENRISLRYALPGKRRQDSVFNGIELLQGNPLVCIHDSARPLMTEDLIRKTVRAAYEYGAAALGVKSKATIKLCTGDDFVVETPGRDYLWEVHTPQVVRLNLLHDGFEAAAGRTVTDDVSLVELLEKPVKMVEGVYTNIKVTTADDLIIAEKYLESYALLQANNSL